MVQKLKYYYIDDEEPTLGRRIFDFFMILLIIFLLGLLIYIGWNYIIPSTPVNLYPNFTSFNPENSNVSDVKQFYPNMKFNHNDLSYSIDSSCEDTKKENVLEALDYIHSKVFSINFHEVTSGADIEVVCYELNREVGKDHFVAGEGGAKEIIQTGRYNVINDGVISLYKNSRNSITCDWPNVELHELMHVFGFDHSNNKNSLMYPFLESCSQELDDVIVKELNRLYSEENLPDLYFSDLSAVKKGIYLDFNLTIKNSGVIDARDVKLTILDNGEKVDTFDLQSINYGSGMILGMENLKLLHRDPKEIKFVIDIDNEIKEFDKGNNIAYVNLYK
jgi:hypothetical protein